MQFFVEVPQNEDSLRPRPLPSPLLGRKEQNNKNSKAGSAFIKKKQNSFFHVVF